MDHNRRQGLAFALGAVLFLGVIGFFPDSAVSIRASKQLLVDLGLLAILGMWIPSKWLRAFYWWSILVLAKRFNPYSVAAFYTILVYIFAFSFIVQKVNKDGIERIYSWIRWTTFVQLALMGLQWFNLDPIFKDLPPEKLNHWVQERPFITGFLDNQMVAGSFLAVVAPLFLSRKWWPGLAAVFLGILMTGSVGSMIVALSVCWWVACRMYKIPTTLKIRVALAAILIAAAGLTLQRPEISHWVARQMGSRWKVWTLTMDLILKDPFMCLTGWGWAQFAPAFQGLVKHFELAPAHLNWTHAHNEYLQTWFEAGLIGLTLAGGFLITSFRRALSSKDPQRFALIGSTLAWLAVAGWSFPAQLAGLNVVALGLFCSLHVMGKTMTEERFWFRCPACRVMVFIGFNQGHGHEPINHGECGYVDQGIVTPLVDATVNISPDFETKLTQVI